MSVITQVDGSDPNQLWSLAALPMAFALDLALGDIVARSYPIRWMNGLIRVVEQPVRRTVGRLGGGRGGDLFGGFLTSFMVVGTVASLVWIITDAADSAGSLVMLITRTVLIAAGLSIRSTGDRILSASEATDRLTARKWLELVGGGPVGRLEQDGVDGVCLAAVGESLSSTVVGPLFWLAIGGPAGFWAFLAIRSVREMILPRREGTTMTGRVSVALADAAEAIPGLLCWFLVTIAAGVVRANLVGAWRSGWKLGRVHPRSVVIWGQAALAGALGVRITSGRVFADDRSEPRAQVGDPVHVPDRGTVLIAVRIMQVTALLAASLVLLVSAFG